MTSLLAVVTPLMANPVFPVWLASVEPDTLSPTGAMQAMFKRGEFEQYSKETDAIFEIDSISNRKSFLTAAPGTAEDIITDLFCICSADTGRIDTNKAKGTAITSSTFVITLRLLLLFTVIMSIIMPYGL
jgi:hypothetical protein